MKQRKFISFDFTWGAVLLLVGITGARASDSTNNWPHDTPDAVTLRNCSITDIHQLTQPQLVKTLNVVHCHISRLVPDDLNAFTSLATLELTDSDLQQIADQTLSGLQQLRTLSLAHNAISDVAAAWSGDVLKTLNVLDLQHNAIASLRTDSFEHYVNLQVLDLAHNALTQLPAGVFWPLAELKLLKLGHNRLTRVEAETFHGVAGLTHLELYSNKIADIATDAFATNLQLRSLYLDGNRLVSLAFLQSAGLARLIQLNVSQNAIVSLEDFAAPQLASLVDLDLSHNRIEEVPDFAMRNFKLLERLNLSGNSLHNIAPTSLAGLHALEHIDLSLNRLPQLPAELFRSTHSLRYINVSYNALTALPATLFTDLPLLRTLDMSGNRLRTPDANGLVAALTPSIWRNRLALTLLLCDNQLDTLNMSALRPFERVELAGNRWNCRWLIREMFHVSFKINFGRDYDVAPAWSNDARLDATGLRCYDADATGGALQQSIIVVVGGMQHMWQRYEPSATPSSTSPSTSPPSSATNCNNNSPPMYNASLPAPWPKLRLNRFDSRSVILWMLFGIAVAFAGLRLGRRLVDRKEHKRVVLELRSKQQALDKRQLIRHSSQASADGQV